MPVPGITEREQMVIFIKRAFGGERTNPDKRNNGKRKAGKEGRPTHLLREDT